MRNYHSIINYKATDSTRSENLNDHDLTSTLIGDFGRWQFWISIMMALLKLPLAWYQLNIIFLAPPQDFWCIKPKFLNQMSVDEWRHICSPKMEEHPCLVFDPELLALAPTMDRSWIPLVECKHFEYDYSVFKRTITSEWNLVCSKHWYINFTQCVMMWGVLLGGLIFGIMADKYGRKKPLMIAILVQSVASYVLCIMLWYWAFLICWFILGLASGGVGIISFVITMEVVSGKWRTIIPILYQLPFGLGTPVMAGLAYWLRDWRKIEFALATLSSFFILYWFCISESPRWLLATGKTTKALEVLKKAAKQNKRKFNYTYTKPKQSNAGKMPGFMSFVRSKNMRLKTILLSINWFCTGLSFYTFSQYLGSIGGDIFVTVAVSGIISTPGALICAAIITRMGRKRTVGIFQIMTAVCFVCLLVIPKDIFTNEWPRLLFAGIGFAGMAGSVPALYLFSGELFPTLGRNAGVSGVSLFARLGSMAAPVVVGLNDIVTDLPLILLAITSFAQILLLIPLPETQNLPLPDTLEQAEKF